MNILFLDSIEKETYGGMEEWIRLVSEGLVAKGHHVTVAGRSGSVFFERIATSERSDDIALLPLAISGDFNLLTIAVINKYIDEKQIHLVVVNFNKDVRLGGLASRLNGGPRVIWSLGLDITSDKMLHRLLTPKLIDGVIVPSMALQSQVTRRGYISPDLVDVIPIGIPDAEHPEDAQERLRAEFKISPSRLIAVTSGRFVHQKGHTYLIDAAALLKQRQVNLVFLLLGDGPLKNELQTKINDMNLNDMFRFVGMVTTVESYLAGVDMMVHPSVEEPFGIAILEGMRASLPVIASRVGGIPEVVKENETALLVEKAHSTQLAESIEKIAHSVELRNTLGMNGRKRWSTEFASDVMTDRLEQYFLMKLSEQKNHI